MESPFQEEKQAEHLYRLIVNNALDAFIAIDEQSVILEWSARAQSMFGWSKEDVLGRMLTDTIIPERERAAHLAGMQHYLKTGEGRLINRRTEMIGCRSDGTEIPVELAVTPVPMPDRMIFFASLRDLTQAKALEEELHRQASITTAVVNNVAGSIVVADQSERLIMVNPAGQQLLNMKPVELDDKQSLDSFQLFLPDEETPYPPELRPTRRALRGEQVDGAIAFIRHPRMPDGAWVSINARPLLDSHGVPSGAVAIFHDITELRRREAELARHARLLQESQAELRLVMDSTDYAIIMLDPDGTVRGWNPGAEKITGLSAQEAIGRKIAVLLFTEEDQEAGRPQQELEHAQRTGRTDDDRWHKRRDGSRFWASGVVTAVRNPDGSVRGFIKILRDLTPQRLAEEQTRFLANHDGLTGLPNRVNFSNHLHQSIALSRRNKVPLALLLLDLDRFKHVNDTFGHHTGDLLLKEVALRIVSSIRETDFVARLGGDEFIIIQSDVSQPEAAETLARKLVMELGRPYDLEGQEIFSGTSIGLCVYPADGSSPVELFKRADLALYRAKNAGRHTYQFYTHDLQSEQTGKAEREVALRGALQNGQFELYYQPQIDLEDWKISTVEALLRWNASDMEMVLPNDFLEIAEQTGVIVELGEWALREACHQVRRWQAHWLKGLRLSVNCSARQFGDPRFVATIPAILQETGLAPSSLELEVSEAMLARHPEIRQQLSELRALGIRLTIDNFGTGAVALIDLKDFGVDVLKIDKAFVQHLPHRREDAAITSTIISLAHNLGINVVAGGVETAEQLAYLKARDCTSAQGFLFSPPVSAAKLEELMLDESWSRLNRVHEGTSGVLH